MRAYILRPFGVKEGIDFDRVHAELIAPALQHLDYESWSADQVMGADLRADLLEQLVTAELVVADLSVSSANLFLELGVRFALRQRHTILISAAGSVPAAWHLNFLRRTVYDPATPADAVGALVAHIRQAIDSQRVDSPIFMAIPRLVPPAADVLQVVPTGFAQEVQRAERSPGHLALLAREVRSFPWQLEGLRQIGAAQFNVKDWAGARGSFEVIQGSEPTDLDANARLATIYQRLKRPLDSSAAVQRLLESPRATPAQRAEFLALHARNIKAEWTESWRSAPFEPGKEALSSPKLASSRDTYLRAFKEDLNHYYSGLNALALTKVRITLAERHIETWTDQFDDDSYASAALAKERELAARLSGALEMAIERARDAGPSEGTNRWLSISEADVALLTGKPARRVLNHYKRALEGALPFELDSVRDQLAMYRDLGVFQEPTEAVLQVIGAESKPFNPFEVVSTIDGVLLFTGHMIDAPNRITPRFPAAMEQKARRAIEEAIVSQVPAPGLMAIAGGSSGGDILFHEVCRGLGIRTELYLAIPEEDYVATAVAPSGPEWVERFRAIREWAPVRVLQASSHLPDWLRRRDDYSVWQRNNQWILQSALAYRTRDVRLVALWNGEESDGPGGTKDMIASARAEGATVTVLNTDSIFSVR